MKLEFNPKVTSEEDQNTIYLLDEPGSYLHASAQTKLCRKLKDLSEDNRVVYCTHSHYLLDPESIPLSNILVAEKDKKGNVTVSSIYNYRGSPTETRSAFQPVLDALRIRPFILDTLNSPVIICEGIYDYYCLEMLKGDRQVSIVPSVGAGSIKFYASMMISWSVPFRCLWDNDPEGRKHHRLSSQYFGSEIAKQALFLLPKRSRQQNRIMQNLFDGGDLKRVREVLGIPSNVSFEKTILSLFYSSNRASIVSGFSGGTVVNFDQLFAALQI